MTYGVKFWGVRGSIACPSPDHIVYGGNTSCVEVKLDDRFLILDAGTGIRKLGHKIMDKGMREGVILLTHTHWDHINGFPFFVPSHNSDANIRVMSGHLSARGGIQAVLANHMSNPMFPVPLDALKANMDFQDFEAGESFTLFDDVHVKTTPLNHPNGATGYRLESGGKSLCYVTDTEHVPGQPDQKVLDLIKGADLVIYDCTYTDDEFPQKIGWGHSTWQEGVRLCKKAGVKKLVIFHHDPEHDDRFMWALEQEARKMWENTVVARDNMEIDL